MSRRARLTPDEINLIVVLADLLHYRHADIARIVECSPYTIVDVLARERATRRK